MNAAFWPPAMRSPVAAAVAVVQNREELPDPLKLPPLLE